MPITNIRSLLATAETKEGVGGAAVALKAEEEKKAALRQRKIEGFWIYEGEELWEKAQDAGNGTKTFSFNNRHHEHVQVFVILHKKPSLRDKEKMIFEAQVCGFNYRNGSNDPSTFAHGTLTAETMREVIYSICH